ncbi:MAG: erythromycin esterase family protein [Myxococcota bacterium]|jgi:erythromycin esterase|nr:erythromycin esterase family protein [Myxococcota bacterium]
MTAVSLSESVFSLPCLLAEDLECPELNLLDELAEGARVLAVGESAHFVRELGMVRRQLTRYFVERRGFTHVALELGQLQAEQLEPWLLGERPESDFEDCAGELTRALYGPFLRWLRNYNLEHGASVRLLGPDLPNTLTLSAELDAVLSSLKTLDPASLRLLREARQTASRIDGASAAVSALQWTTIPRPERDLLCSSLSQLALRFEVLEGLLIQQGGEASFLRARQLLETARYTEQMLRAMSELFEGGGLEAATSIRDCFAARTLSRALTDEPGRRVLLLAHNNHIQKEPVCFAGELSALPMGKYLAEQWGHQYRALALTHLGQQVPEMLFPQPESSLGFGVGLVELPEAETGSVEHALLSAAVSPGPLFLRLGSDSQWPELTKIRSQSGQVEARLDRAFDGVLAVSQASMEND